ncbi:MAG: O-acetylhomoserine aminocarboxypropyltransferase/cysteine synthase [Trueperaceae bacterium]|nr:O-acetylhomoserine aminocarboxypropyltransferase/cysteine synthase [Trueperaceae bacterium]
MSDAFDTLQIHAGTAPDPTTGARAVPIYATSSYVFSSAAEAAELFGGEREGNQYARMHNPTTEVLAQRLTALEGGAAGVALASGQAASAATLLALAAPGASVVMSSEVFGGTYALFRKWLEPWGVRLITVAPTAEAVRAAADETTVAVWVETIANPSGSVPDLAAVAEAAHAAGAPFVVDNTWGCAGYLCRPFDHGADVVVHSATKWIGGHGTVVAGAMIDAGRFDWSAGRVPALLVPDAKGRTPLERFGATALAGRVFDLGLFTIGATLSPFASFLALQGLETLSLRVDRSCASALTLARSLRGRPGVRGVVYPGLEEHPSFAVASRVLRGGFGAVLGIDLGDVAGAHAFIDRLRLVSHLANIGDAKSVAIHPWTTTHQGLSEEARRAAGVTPGLVRLSVGLEDVADVERDLVQALAGAA